MIGTIIANIMIIIVIVIPKPNGILKDSSNQFIVIISPHFSLMLYYLKFKKAMGKVNNII